MMNSFWESPLKNSSRLVPPSLIPPWQAAESLLRTQRRVESNAARRTTPLRKDQLQDEEWHYQTALVLRRELQAYVPADDSRLVAGIASVEEVLRSIVRMRAARGRLLAQIDRDHPTLEQSEDL